MPGPTTEVLSDDLKEVCSDLHRVGTTLAAEIHKAEVTLVAEIHQGNKALALEIHKVGNAVAKLGGEFAVFKWLLGATLATTVSGIVGSAYWVGSLASRVTALEGRFDKFDGRIERIESRLSGIDGRLERIEASIIKAIGRVDESETPTSEKR